MKWTIVLIYMLRVSQQAEDLELKQKLLDEWDVSDDANEYDNVVAADEIVIDFFKKPKKEERTKQFSDEVIILPFFSDEVLSFDDIPEDKNWNFVEINSDTDLLAMENPHQKKYKTQIYKMKAKESKKLHKKASKVHNNWHALKDRFPKQVGFKQKLEVIPDFEVVEPKTTKKEKRQTGYYPYSKGEETSSNKFIPSANDPWQNVNIIEDQNTQLAFGSYDEYGNKIRPRKFNEKKSSDDHFFKHMDKFSGPLFRNKKEIGNHDQIINITIDLDEITNVGNLPKLNIKPDIIQGFKLFQKHTPTNSNAPPTKKPLRTTFKVFNPIKKFDAIDDQIEELEKIRSNKDKIPKADSQRTVFQVFNPIKVFHPQNADETPRATKKNITEKMLSKKIDDLYNKITSLKNFEAFKDSPSELTNTGISKLNKPTALIMKQDKLKLTKPVVLDLFDRTDTRQPIQNSGNNTNKKAKDETKTELGNSDAIVVNIEEQTSVQKQTLSKLKKQIQGLKPPKPKASPPPKPKWNRPPRPKRGPPPKPNGSPRNQKKFQKPIKPKNTSHKRDLKDPRTVQNNKGKEHRKHGKNKAGSGQSAPRNSEKQKQLPWSHHGLPPQVLNRPGPEIVRKT